MALENINMQTGAAQQASAFADRLEGFKRESLGRLSQASAQIGQQEGTQAAAEYVEKKKAGEEAELEFRNNFGVSGQAYNKALGTAYKASVKSDLSAGLNALAVEYPDDIATYNDMSQDLIKSTIQGADSSLQDELYLDSELINTQYQKQVQGNSIKANLKAAADEQNRAKQTIYDNSLGLLANAKTEEDAALAAASLSSAFEVIEQQRENGEITEEQAAQQRTMMAKGFAEQSFLNTVDNAETIDQAYDSLEKLYSEVPAGWSPQDWDSVVSKAEKSYNRMARKEAAKIEASTKANKEAALFAHGQSLFDNNIRIDPKNTTDESKENLQAINSYYDGISQDWDSLPVEQYINNSVEFIERTGIMPTKLESRINAFARSGDSQQVLAAAEIVSRVQEQSPQALADMSGETRAIMLSVVDAQRSGTDIDVALESARTAAYSQTQAQREEIRIKIKDVAEDLPDNLQKFLDDSSDDKWYTLGAPDASPAMSAEFRVSFEKYMNLTGGNTKNAQALAYQDLRKVWAVSDITGGYMKYAPEAMYGMPGGNNAWISQQFKDDTAGYGEGVTIAATPATARSPRPEYALMIADDSGALTPVYDENGMPSAWQPDFTETQDYKDLQELPEKTIAAAQEKRERYQAQKLNKLAGLIRSKEFLKKNKNYSNAINNALLAEEINEVEAEQLKVLFDVEQKEQKPESVKPKRKPLSTPSKSVKQSEENLKNLTEDELIQAYKEARPGPVKESLGRALSAMVDSSMNNGGA